MPVVYGGHDKYAPLENPKSVRQIDKYLAQSEYKHVNDYLPN